MIWILLETSRHMREFPVIFKAPWCCQLLGKPVLNAHVDIWGFVSKVKPTEHNSASKWSVTTRNRSIDIEVDRYYLHNDLMPSFYNDFTYKLCLMSILVSLVGGINYNLPAFWSDFPKRWKKPAYSAHQLWLIFNYYNYCYYLYTSRLDIYPLLQLNISPWMYLRDISWTFIDLPTESK